MEAVSLPATRVTRFAWAVAGGWTVAVAASLFLNLSFTERKTRDLARVQADRAVEQGLVYRDWNAGHGGVYVPVTERTQPNPHLEHPAREVTTTDGKELTLINPAYMTRQVHELLGEESGYLGHITSLNPIRPANAADAWETNVLQRFATNPVTFGEVAEIGGEPYMRVMKPLVTEAGCLKCHAKQGYQLGDIRGGLSVSVPMKPGWEAARPQKVTLSAAHFFLWLLGLGGISVGRRRIVRHLERREAAVTEMTLSGRRLSEAQRIARLGNWEWDVPSDRIEWSDEIFRMFQVPTGTPVSYEMFLDRVHADDREMVKGRVKEALAGGRDYDVVHRIRLSDGTVRFVRERAHVRRDGAGKPLSMLGTVLDITESERVGRILAAANSVAERLLGAPSWDEAVVDVLAELGRAVDVSRVYLFRVDRRDDDRWMAHQLHEWVTEGIRPEIDNPSLEEFDFEAAGFSRWPAVLEQNEPIQGLVSEFPEVEREFLRSQDIRSMVVVPLRVRGRWWGFVGFDECRYDRQWEAAELQALGTVTSLLGQACDRELGIAELRETEHQVVELLDCSLLPAILIDEKQRVILMNHEFTRVFGYTKDDVSSATEWWPLAYPEPDYRRKIIERWQSYVEDIAAGRVNEPMRDIRIRCKDGRERIADVSLSLFRNRGLVVFNDLTDRIETERELRDRQERLNLMGSALEAAANGVLITDAEGTIQWINPAVTEITGYSAEELIGQNPRIMKSGKHDEAFYHQMWKTLKSGRVWNGSFINRRKDGALYNEDTTITPVCDAEGTISHYIAIKRDVTEQKQLEQQFLRAQRMESLGLLAGGVAHDLNNVLAPILMAVELLREDVDPESQTALIDTLRTNCERGADIIKQVLAFSRGMEGERVVLQLRHLVKDMVKMARETFPKDIDVSADVPRDLWTIHGDATQIHQVLLNLAVNARDAMPTGGRLTFHAENVELQDSRRYLNLSVEPGHYVKLSVKDTGGGIRPEIKERMFDPFFTTKEQGKGTGLGLATVMGVVKSHDGMIELETAIGKGSTFHVWLPAVETAEEIEEETKPVALPRGNGETILVVDDEVGVRQVTGAILRRSGYKTLVAEDGAAAIATYADHQDEIAVVVTDIMMPLMDGIALLRSLRQLRPEVKVIGISGLVGEPGKKDRTQELHDLGVKTILGKPFSALALLNAVRDELDSDANDA